MSKCWLSTKTVTVQQQRHCPSVSLMILSLQMNIHTSISFQNQMLVFMSSEEVLKGCRMLQLVQVFEFQDLWSEIARSSEWWEGLDQLPSRPFSEISTCKTVKSWDETDAVTPHQSICEWSLPLPDATDSTLKWDSHSLICTKSLGNPLK